MDKPHKCEFCGKPFSLKRYHLDHIRIHTGDKNLSSAEPVENYLHREAVCLCICVFILALNLTNVQFVGKHLHRKAVFLHTFSFTLEINHKNVKFVGNHF